MKKIMAVIAAVALAPAMKRQWMKFWREAAVVADERRFREGHL